MSEIYTAKQLSHMQSARLFEIANSELGLGIAETEDLALVREAILAKQGDADAPTAPEVKEEAEEVMPEKDFAQSKPSEKISAAALVEGKAPAPAKGKSKHDELLEITVHEGRGIDGKFPAKLTHNGVLCLVPRGKRVKIKRKFCNVMDYAVEILYERNEDTNEIISREVPRYTYTIHGPA